MKEPRPGRRLAALRDKIERSGDDSALRFAAWLIKHGERDDLPQLISWIETCDRRQVAEALRQTEIRSPPASSEKGRSAEGRAVFRRHTENRIWRQMAEKRRRKNNPGA
jgi:hypothetical protein